MNFEIRVSGWGVDDSTHQATESATVRTLRPREDQGSTHAPTGTKRGTISDLEMQNIESDRRSIDAFPQSPAVARRALWRQAGDGLTEISLDRLPRGGEPTLGATGVTVSQILGLIADGYDIDRIVTEYEGVVTYQEVREAILFASRLSS